MRPPPRSLDPGHQIIDVLTAGVQIQCISTPVSSHDADGLFIVGLCIDMMLTRSARTRHHLGVRSGVMYCLIHLSLAEESASSP